MKKILIIVALLFSVIATAQQYHDKGAKFENATSVGDTISNNTRIPIIDEFGLVNYYVDVADLLALNPVPSTPNLQQVTNAGNTTTNKIIVTGTDGTIPQDGMYIASPGLGQGIVMNRNSSTQSSSSINFLPTTSQFQFSPVSQNATTLTIREETPTDAGIWTNTRMQVLPAVNANDAVTLSQLDNVTITESQITDLKDYLRGDINDTNGANKLTLGSLEVTGQTILQNGLNMTSVPVGTSDNILTLNTVNGDVEQRVFSLGNIDIANAAGVSQFSVGLDEQLRFEGLNDASVSFNGATKTITVSATGGSSGEGGVDTFNGRDGAVVSQAGDYSTTQVSEGTNLYFTEPRVRATSLTGLTIANTPISSTNTFLQALGRLQGQINDRYTKSEANGNYVNVTGDAMTGDLFITPTVTGGAGTTANTIQIGRITNGTFISSGNNAGGAVSYVLRGYSSSGVQMTLNEGALSAQGEIAVRAVGTGTGTANLARVGFFESNGTVEQGYIGFASSTRSDLNLRNFTGNTFLQLIEEGGVNGLQYVYNGNVFENVYHSGNLRSNAQNDARYAIMNSSNTGSLTVTSTITASNFILSSDIRLKENIRPLGNGYYSFNFKDDKTKSKRYGVIAQEVDKYAPELVSEGEDGYKKVAYIDLLIKKIAELTKRVEELEKK